MSLHVYAQFRYDVTCKLSGLTPERIFKKKIQKSDKNKNKQIINETSKQQQRTACLLIVCVSEKVDN